MNVYCNAEGNEQYACYSPNIYCPNEASCNINCDTSLACFDSTVYISSQEYKGLDLNCNPSLNDVCSDIDIECIDSGLSTRYGYDSVNSYWRCNDFDCCPENEGNVTCSEGSNCMVC